jgi:MFS family permease
MAMTANGLTVVVCTVLIATLSHRLPALINVALGYAFYAVGFASYVAATGLPLVLGSTVVWTIGEILAATNANAFVADHTPPSHRGRVNSVVAACTLSGSALAPMVGGVAARAMGTRAVWIPIGLFAALASTGALLLHRFDLGRQKTESVIA